MATHTFRIAALIVLIVLCTILPFLPGRYDSAAAPLSLMAQLFGKVGPLLILPGVLWLIMDRRPWSSRARHAIRIFALFVSAFVCLVLTLVIVESIVFGVLTLAAGAYLMARFLRYVMERRSETTSRRSALPAYMIVVPLGVTLIQLSIADPITEFSRDRAIRNSADLIADIERHRVANGRYPLSSLSVWPDYKPSIVGIREYRYEPFGDAYNVVFELPSFTFGTRELVVYNPRDEQAISSHAMDVMQLSPEALALDRTRGHYAVHVARQPHWKYVWFD